MILCNLKLFETNLNDQLNIMLSVLYFISVGTTHIMYEPFLNKINFNSKMTRDVGYDDYY